MSNTANTFFTSKEQLRKLGSRTSARNDGNIPKNSEAAFMQSIIDRERNKHATHLSRPDLPEPVSGADSCVDIGKSGRGVGGRVPGHASRETMRGSTTQASAARMSEGWGKEVTL